MSIGSPKKGSKCEGTILAYKKNKPGLITVRFFNAGFHSRDQQPCFSTKTKGSVCIIIELNSRRIWSGHQHGGRDVM